MKPCGFVESVCGIDLGTQSVKVLIYRPETRSILASAQAPLSMISEEDGTREQEASWYAEALDACFSAIPDDMKKGVAALGVSGQQHGFVPLDAEGKPIRPVKLWCDTSTAAECAELTEAAGGEAALLAETGMPMLPGYTAPKILWLKRHEPERFLRLRHVLLPHDYLNYLLTGSMTAEA
ncbi:MAG TPA: FGGY family carbohydrate kinase, partial [Rectinemataceae bacterium]